MSDFQCSYVVVNSPSKSRFCSIVFIVWELSSSHMVHLKGYILIQFIIKKRLWLCDFLTLNMSFLASKTQVLCFVCYCLFSICFINNHCVILFTTYQVPKNHRTTSPSNQKTRKIPPRPRETAGSFAAILWGNSRIGCLVSALLCYLKLETIVWVLKAVMISWFWSVKAHSPVAWVVGQIDRVLLLLVVMCE